MAIPLVPAGIAGLKAGLAALKGLGAKKAVMAGGRMAGKALGNTGKFLLNNAGSNPVEVGMRIGPDIFFGGMTALQTPGDLGDKLIAGGTQALGGVVGGIGAGGLAKKAGLGSGAQTLIDMAGSVGGDYAGMYVGDAALRAKGGGTTPWEKLAEEDKRRLEQEILATYGLAGYRPHELIGGMG
jgi:hypothetical protein